ncbi:MAG: histidine phosphatase family protein [Oscillospiraceae bacterium]
MRTYKIHLVRHGYTKANLDGAYCGSTDLPLCPEGERDLYDILSECSYPSAELVYVSPLVRARQTAEILWPECEQIVVDGLREASFGRFEGKTFASLQGDEEFERWIVPGSDFKPDGVEDQKRFFERCVAAFRFVVDDMMSKSVFSAAVVTHAGVIGNVLAALAYPKRAPYDWQSRPGCGFTVSADPTIYLREPVVEVVASIPEEDEDDARG